MAASFFRKVVVGEMSRKLYKNPISRFSFVMAIMVFVLMFILLLLDFVGVPLNPVIGMLTYTLFPALLVLYVLLIPVGMYVEWRRRHKREGLTPPRFPSIDFNIKNHRIQLYVVIGVVTVVGIFVLAASYRAYEYTSSVHFCGELCHNVMEPEATTYKNSPHARVTCVQCHVGQGATWYVKSKLSGLYQVYATLFDKYPRPIETPIKHLRPSADTCEQCHWPSKFFGGKQVLKTHYEENEQNTPRQFFMLLNVGGGVTPTGIHWHVAGDEVYYIARDEKRQDIPWIKVKRKDGREVTYVDSENPPTGEEIAKAEMRKMDCLDCHNRPTHIFETPREALDSAISEGRVSRNLPYIKQLGAELLAKNYLTVEEAEKEIRNQVTAYYKEKYPKVAVENAGLIEKTIEEFQAIWDANNFPEMKSNWSVYPNNLGHLTWPGCFRCHSGKHMNESGDVVTKKCNACHLFLSESLSKTMSAETALGKPFEHPVDVGGEERKSRCIICHEGR